MCSVWIFWTCRFPTDEKEIFGEKPSPDYSNFGMPKKMLATDLMAG